MTLIEKIKYFLFGESLTLSGAYAEASVSAMKRATNYKNRGKK